MGVLILVDALEDKRDIIASTFNSLDLRKTSCRAIFNATSLALNKDRYSPQNDSRLSALLLSPNPDILVTALVRTSSSIQLLHDCSEISSRAAEQMYAIVIAGLETLSAISYLAFDAIAPLKRSLSELGQFPDPLSSIVNLEGSILPLIGTSGIFNEQTVKELKEQASTNPELAMQAIERHEVQSLESILQLNEAPSFDFVFPLQDWDFQVSFSYPTDTRQCAETAQDLLQDY
jgi:hypothetical protein